MTKFRVGLNDHVAETTDALQQSYLVLCMGAKIEIYKNSIQIGISWQMLQIILLI